MCEVIVDEKMKKAWITFCVIVLRQKQLTTTIIDGKGIEYQIGSIIVTGTWL